MKKYYCPTCKQFKSRFEVKKEDYMWEYVYRCKWCHKSGVITTEQFLLKQQNQINSLFDTITSKGFSDKLAKRIVKELTGKLNEVDLSEDENRPNNIFDLIDNIDKMIMIER